MPKLNQLTGSLRQIADALAVDRSVIARLVKDRGINPIGRAGAHPTYAVRDLAAALRESDPERESPFQQLARAKAARERMKLAAEARELIPRLEVQQGYAKIMKAAAHSLDTLPDLLERDCGLSPAAIARTERAIDALRVELHRALVADGQGDTTAATDSPTRDEETPNA